MSLRIFPLLSSAILLFAGGAAAAPSLNAPSTMQQEGNTLPKAESVVALDSRVNNAIAPFSIALSQQQPSQQTLSRQIDSNREPSLKQNRPLKQPPSQGLQPRSGRASDVADNFRIGMDYASVLEELGPPDLTLTRNTVYRWEQGMNAFTIIYNEAGQFAGSGWVQRSPNNPLSETDKEAFRQLRNRYASYAEFVQALGEATTTLEEVEYAWLYEDNLFLRLVVLEDELVAVYWAPQDTTCFRCSIAYL